MKIFLENRMIQFLDKEPRSIGENDLVIKCSSGNQVLKVFEEFEKNDIYRNLYIWSDRQYPIISFMPNSQSVDSRDTLLSYSTFEEEINSDFFSLFKILEAAGGLIRNEIGEILFIFKNGRWDLPKGKINTSRSNLTARFFPFQNDNPLLYDINRGKKKVMKNISINKAKHESPEYAAIREVKEETGLKEVKLLRQLRETFHIYYQPEKRILKRTCWFEMFAAKDQFLKPDKKENISIVRWVNKIELDSIMKNTYASIKDLLSDWQVK